MAYIPYTPRQVQTSQQQMGGYNPNARTTGNAPANSYTSRPNTTGGYNPYGSAPRQNAIPEGPSNTGGMLPYNRYQQPTTATSPAPALFNGNYPPQVPRFQGTVPNYQTPTYTPQGGTAPNGGQFNYYPGLDPTSLEPNDEREARLQAVQASLPIAQFNQNNYQWQSEYDQANQRYWDQTGWQRQGDQFNMNLAAQQQVQAEWQAQQAANQWGQEFGRQTGLDQFNQNFSQQQFGLQEWQTQEQLRQAQQQQAQGYQLSQDQLAQLRAYQTGQLGIGNRELDIRSQSDQNQFALGQGQLSQQANELAQLRAYQTGQLGLGQGQLDLATRTQTDTSAYQMGQLGVAQRQNEIDQMYKSGQLSLGQAQQALAELTQSQNYGLQQGQFGLAQQTQNSLEAYRNAQLAQEAALTREQMAAQQQIATMNQFGRNRSPNTKWIRAS